MNLKDQLETVELSIKYLETYGIDVTIADAIGNTYTLKPSDKVVEDRTKQINKWLKHKEDLNKEITKRKIVNQLLRR